MTQQRVLVFVALFVAASAVTACGEDEGATPGARTPNAIVLENRRPGTPQAVWDIPDFDRPGIEGFASEFSVRTGDTVHFKVRTKSSDYRLDLYRFGWYDGLGARHVATVEPSRLGDQPPCLFDPETKLVDCRNWFDSAAWQVPDDAVSGVYFAKLVREDSPHSGANHVLFVVREREPHSALLLQTSDTTWQAYNSYADSPDREHNLYRPRERSAKRVSYNRPLRVGSLQSPPAQHFRDGRHGFFAAEYAMVRFLERNGYDVSYFSGADTARFGDTLPAHRVFLSVGHDEYWSKGQRLAVERARDAGMHLAFFSGNEVYWKIRWEEDHRIIACYKGPEIGLDGVPHPVWTGTWDDPQGTDTGAPTNTLTGTTGGVALTEIALEVPAPHRRLRFWRDTAFANTPPNEVARSIDGIVGYEWNGDVENGHRPAGLIRLSDTPNPGRRRTDSPNDAVGRPTRRPSSHQATLYRASSGALVFGAATIQWSWGLDGFHPPNPATSDATTSTAADPNLKQATVNLLADMGVQPETLEPGLVRAVESQDAQPPTVSIANLRGPLRVRRPVRVSGAAQDEDGVVAAVEVEFDSVWRRAKGTESWSIRLTPAMPGPIAIRARAVDDSGNLSEAVSATLGTVLGGP